MAALWLLFGLAMQTNGAIHTWGNHRQPDIKKLYRMNEEMVEKSESLENSIKSMMTMRANEIQGGSFELIASSWGDDTALEEAKTAYILAKTSCAFLDQCKMGGMSANECLKSMSSVTIKDEIKQVCSESEYRSPDGSCNNNNQPDWGAAYSPYSRILGSSAYKDGIWFSDVGNTVHPNPLNISSNLLHLMVKDLPDVTFGFAAWTKLVSNDLSHTPSYRSFFTKENVKCCRTNDYRTLPRYRHPMCFYMNGPDDVCVSYSRSMLAIQETQLGPAEQMNMATHFLDASNIYGNNQKVQNALRLNQGGKLKEVPTSDILEPINCIEKDKCFLTGDVRNILDPSSAAGSLLLTKEHNRIARILSVLNPEWDDEKLYLESKRILIAELQHITYKEWLPLVIGRKKYSEKSFHLQISSGYADLYEAKDPSVFNEFATAALVPLTLMPEIHLKKMNKRVNEARRFAAIDPDLFQNRSFIETLGKSLKMQFSHSQIMFFDEMKSLFEDDLDSNLEQTLGIEIHRGRDHGLLPFFKYGDKFNFQPIMTEKNSDLLKKLFKNQNQVDLLVGGILEKKEKRSFVGKTFQEIIARQMSSTRKGDKFFYDNSQQPYPFTLVQLNEIKKASFARLVCDNFGVESIQNSAFLPQSDRNLLVNCKDEDQLKIVDLRYWRQ